MWIQTETGELVNTEFVRDFFIESQPADTLLHTEEIWQLIGRHDVDSVVIYTGTSGNCEKIKKSIYDALVSLDGGCDIRMLTKEIVERR